MLYILYIERDREREGRLKEDCYKRRKSTNITVRLLVHAQHQKRITPTIPKDPIDDHEINIYSEIKRKNENRKNAHYQSLLCLLAILLNKEPLLKKQQ